MTHRSFTATGPSGIDHQSFPMQLWHKAKQLGVWDPRQIDFTTDAEQWSQFDEREREVLLDLSALFLGGEEAVTLDLLPLIMVMAREGRLEEEMFLTSFLWEEAKHVEAFRRFLDEVAHEQSDLTRFHTDSYNQLFHHELPEAMERLAEDPSPIAQARASVTYNMIVEGTLAETGYHAYLSALEENDLLPGMREVIANLNRDESRHIAYGIYLISRLVSEHGEEVWQAVEARMNELLPLALSVIDEMLGKYDELPFGLTHDMFIDYATKQYQKRYARILRARNQTLGEVADEARSAEEAAAQ